MGNSYLKANLLQKIMEMREGVLYEVFLVLRKAYDTIDQDHCLKILVAYRIGLRMKRLLRRYWDGITMVARVGRYYCTPFKGSSGVTQCDPMSLTIFNMVMEKVI